MSDDTCGCLERIWASEAVHVRRMLIGLTRDIDLADDLLQETYLKARDGLASYRGENDRAWLCTIARNAYISHTRHRYVSAEISDDGECKASYSPVGTPDHIELMRIRNAISELRTDLRTALLMKHYCGFTYPEIAESAGCPVGTAKWRVSVAIGKLKEALGMVEEHMELTCKDLSRTKIIDYSYGGLAPDEIEAIKRHIEGCPICQSQVDETSKIISALDALENDMRTIDIIEIDREGVPRHYVISQFAFNDTVEPVTHFCASKCYTFEYMGANGQDIPFTCEENDNPNYPDTYTYHLTLPQSLADGKMHNLLSICREEENVPTRDEDGTWEYTHTQLTSVDHDWAYVLAIRLPLGARVISVDPPTVETMRSTGTTLLWQVVRKANEGFGCVIRYRLDDDAR